MNDLIDKNAAIDAVLFGLTYVKAFDKETGEVKEPFSQGNYELMKAVDRIKGLPSTDAIEVRRGRWMRGTAYPHHIFCSVCYATYIPNDEIPLWKSESYFNVPRNYCPYCGAKMDEEKPDATFN